MIIWLCGLSGSGKSTIGREIADLTSTESDRLVLVDGDQVRAIFGLDSSPLAYSLEGRRRNAEIIDRTVAWLDHQNVSVVAAVQSIFPDLLRKHREVFNNYYEVHLDASLGLLRRRDPKSLHANAKRTGGADVVGYGIPYQRPGESDLYIDMDSDRRTPRDMAAEILARARGTYATST